jgi:hypothetical protein
MACKHEGGSDPCDMNRSGQCRARTRARQNERRVENHGLSQSGMRKQKGLCIACGNPNDRVPLTKCSRCAALCNAYTTKYQKELLRGGLAFSGATQGNLGEAAELIVAADFLSRGLEVTKPFNRNCDDDLHVKVSVGWKNVQVKSGRVNQKTGHILRPQGQGRGNRITSQIIATVDVPNKRVRYISNTKEPIPKELR